MTRALRGAAASGAAGRRSGACGALGLLSVIVHPAVAFGAEAVVPPPSSAAAPATVHLEYRRGAGAAACIAPVQLQADVEARLGRRVFVAPREAELEARVTARRVARRFVVEVELFDRARRSLGKRELSTRAPHCSSLDDSLALVLALAADMPRELPAAPAPAASAGPEAAPRVAGAPTSAAPTAVPLLTPVSIPETTHAPRIGVRLRPSLGVAAASGVVPSIAPGLEVGLELRSSQFWPLALQGTGFARAARDAPAPAKGATFSAQTLALAVCPWTRPIGGFQASACVVQCLGRVRARGVGFDEEQRDEGWFVSFGGGVSLAYWFGPVFVGTSGTLLVPMVRRRYFFTDAADVTLYEQPWLSGLVALRVGTEI